MEIYVRSRGVSEGYSWLNEQLKEVSLLPNLQSVIQLIDSDSFSVVIYRFEDKLALLATGLESKTRTDNRTRTIRNSILWIAEESKETDLDLRMIAVQALSGKLATKVDKAIQSSNNSPGFQVDFSKLDFKQLVDETIRQNQSPDPTLKIGNLSSLRDELIQELKKCHLPRKQGILLLIVVSETISQKSLENKKVWRGLSNTITSQDEWIEIAPDNENLGGFNWIQRIFPNNQDFQPRRNGLLSFFLLLILIISLSTNVWLFYERQQINNIQEQREKLNKEIEELKNQRDSLNQDINKYEKAIKDYKDLQNDVQKLFETFKGELERLQERYFQISKDLNR